MDSGFSLWLLELLRYCHRARLAVVPKHHVSRAARRELASTVVRVVAMRRISHGDMQESEMESESSMSVQLG